MIWLGLDQAEKGYVIERYMEEHPEVNDVVMLSHEPFRLSGWEQYSWDDAIMYRVFYPLLERIGENTLVVVNEMMRTRDRNSLTYNCMHHYLNQTKHRIVFEWFPLIEGREDMLILLDYDHPNKYKGRGFDPAMLAESSIKGYRRVPPLIVHLVYADEEIQKRYEAEKEKLFAGLGNGDPDVIPRRLHLWTGKYKPLDPGTLYVARNKRFGRDNVGTFKDAAHGDFRVMIDMPHRMIDLTDYLKTTEQTELCYLCADLPVDRYYRDRYEAWAKEAGALYDLAGIQ